METTQMYEEAPNAATIWAILQRTARLQEENSQGLKEMREQSKETDKRMEESDRRMEESSKRLDKQLGKLGNRLGEMVEYMVVPNLVAKFQELGFEFEITHRDTEIVNRKHNIFTEVDVFLENDDKVMAVEIKNKLKTKDIDEHLERMEKLRFLADIRGDKRKYLGAIAGMVFSESEKAYALKNGLYVIEPSGDTFTITEPSGKYHPREW